MADHDIQKSQHLLKRLNEEIDFLTCLLEQTRSLLDQSKYVASDLKITQTEIYYSLQTTREKEV